MKLLSGLKLVGDLLQFVFVATVQVSRFFVIWQPALNA